MNPCVCIYVWMTTVGARIYVQMNNERVEFFLLFLQAMVDSDSEENARCEKH